MAAATGGERGLVKPLGPHLTINLIPPERRKKHHEAPRLAIPQKPILVGCAVILFATWIFSGVRTFFATRELVKLEQELGKLQVPKTEADQLAVQWNEITGTRAFMDHMVFPGFDWTAFLDVMTQNLPANIWLSSLVVELSEPHWKIEVQGYAKPSSEQEMLDSVSSLSAALKKWLDIKWQESKPKREQPRPDPTAGAQAPASAGLPGGAPMEGVPSDIMNFLASAQQAEAQKGVQKKPDEGTLRVETVTSRKQAGRLVITEFTLTFDTTPKEQAEGGGPGVPVAELPAGVTPESLGLPAGAMQQR